MDKKNIKEHEGSKYIRKIYSSTGENMSSGTGLIAEVDVYEVLLAFNVTCPARQHAIKKLLCAGIRGKGGELEDLKGALAAVNRAIDIQERVEARRDLESKAKESYDRRKSND